MSSYTSGTAIVGGYAADEAGTMVTSSSGGGAASEVDVLSISAGDNNIGNVDLASPVPAGTNNIGDVDIASIAAGNNNIGDVDIASIAAGDNNIGNVDVVSSALPTGAATAANQTTEITALSAIQTAVETLDNTVSGSELQVDVVTLPSVTIGTFPDNEPMNVAQIGGTAAVSGGVNGSLGVGGLAADDAAAAGNPVQVGGVARSTDPTVATAGDQVAALYTTSRKQVMQLHCLSGERWSYAAASGGITNTTGVTVKAAVAGQRNCLYSVDMENGHASTSTEVVIRDGASGTVIKRWWTQAGGGGVARRIEPPVCTSTNTLLEVAAITTGAAIYFNAEGCEED